MKIDFKKHYYDKPELNKYLVEVFEYIFNKIGI
jgi:hypothetical protein